MITQARGGRIICISSIHAVLSEPNAGIHGLQGRNGGWFARTLASELAPYKITVITSAQVRLLRL